MTAPDDIQIVDPRSFLSHADPDNRLTAYFDLLRLENRKINLVSRETLSPDSENNAPLQALAAESLLPLSRPEIRNVSRYLDIGSGGGFPALPIILTQQIESVTLVERIHKKAGALRRMLINLGCQATVESRTFEELSFQSGFDLITVRLVKLTPRLLKAISFWLSDDGHLVYYSKPEFEPSAHRLESSTHYYTIDSDTPPKCFTLLKKV